MTRVVRQEEEYEPQECLSPLHLQVQPQHCGPEAGQCDDAISGHSLVLCMKHAQSAQ